MCHCDTDARLGPLYERKKSLYMTGCMGQDTPTDKGDAMCLQPPVEMAQWHKKCTLKNSVYKLQILTQLESKL